MDSEALIPRGTSVCGVKVASPLHLFRRFLHTSMYLQERSRKFQQGPAILLLLPQSLQTVHEKALRIKQQYTVSKIYAETTEWCPIDFEDNRPQWFPPLSAPVVSSIWCSGSRCIDVAPLPLHLHGKTLNWGGVPLYLCKSTPVWPLLVYINSPKCWPLQKATTYSRTTGEEY